MEKTTDKAVAVEILRQLGGNRFRAMTGAKDFVCDSKSLRFRLSGTMTKNRINVVTITLNSMDTYDIKLQNVRAGKLKDVELLDGIYNDQLQEILSDRTGLALSL